ncbi:MAG: hypothetical protein SPL42_02150, partial [Bacteroidales bacterium]|nr:hypothetical protein [Bacteroidales bacterium]
MKKFIVFLTVFTASFALSGQTYQPWSPTAGMGPLTFNRITGPYVKTKYMQSSGGWYGGGYETLEGIKQYPNGMASHSLITQQGDDHCRCLEVSNNNVIYQKKLLPSWSGVPSFNRRRIVIACRVDDAVADVVFEDDASDAAQCGIDSRQLDQHVAAIVARFDHALDFLEVADEPHVAAHRPSRKGQAHGRGGRRLQRCADPAL